MLPTVNQPLERQAIERGGGGSDRMLAGADVGQGVDAELARIVAAWSELPTVLKGAMLAIVDSAGAASGR